MFLVVGLGNPGKAYSLHRHNVGFVVIDELARAARADTFREKFSGEWARARLGDVDAVLLKPATYMNESGRSVQPAAAFFKVPPERVLVVHDELDLPFGTLRLKMGGGHAGHNGLRSIAQTLGTVEFPRLRFGVGRPPADFGGEVRDYVLSGFDPTERSSLPARVVEASSCVLEVAARGLAAAMKEINTPPEKRRQK